MKLSVIRGIPNNPTFNAERMERVIDTFVSKNSDVFVCTYVKAGTTWIQQIVHCLLRRGEPGGRYSETVPWLEACYASDLLDSREAPGWSPTRIENNTERRYFKTHATVNDFPGRASGAKPKVIYCARNPKDTMVSLFNHAKSKPEFEYQHGDFESFFNLFIKGEVENGLWFNHVLDWHAECVANPTTHLFLQYEEMHTNTLDCIRKIAEFLEIEVTDDELKNVLKNSTMSEMRNNSESNIGMNHLRQGQYGTWRKSFTVYQSNIFDEVLSYITML
jgi:hypothetical protein